MCGIGAVFAPDGVSDDRALREAARRLSAAQAHRGPDGEGLWSDARHCALGHRRLAVIDLSEAAAQPMADADGRYVVSYNGEIYNFEELRRELEAQGARFRTRSDTEVLLAAWAQWGHGAFSRFDGMYAAAIYDTRERRLMLVRDPSGEKPLFYVRDGGRYVAASELRALAAVLGAPRLDPIGVFAYLALRYVPAPRTIFEGVRALEPGSVLEIDASGECRRQRIGTFDRIVDAPPSAAAETLDRLENELTLALERRLVADVPLGAFLSGGVDSGLVCALASRRLHRSLETFCAGFEGETDETAAARRVAQALGLPHRSLAISSSDLLSLVDGFGKVLDEPNGDRSCVPLYLLSREVRRTATVALTGDGGDELFCGYGRYRGFGESCARAGASSPAAAIAHYFERALPVFSPAALGRLLPEERAAWDEEFLSIYLPAFMRPGWSDAQRLSVLDFHTYLPGAVLAKSDRMSMRHGLELRTPYLAPAVLQLAASLGPDACGRGGELKPALRTILRRHLPETLIAPQKTGFGMPPGFMERNREFFGRMFERACEALRAVPFFAERPVVLEQLQRAAPGHVNSYWALTVLGLWADSVGLARTR